MGFLKNIAGFVVRRGTEAAGHVIGVAGAKEAIGWTVDTVATHFKPHTHELSEALIKAHETAWSALGFALGDDSALDLFRSADNKALREELRTFLSTVARGMAGAGDPEFRAACLHELKRAKSAGLLDAGAIDMDEVARHLGSFSRMGSGAAILDAERQAMNDIAAEFPAGTYPNLNRFLAMSPGDGEPFLTNAAGFFFKLNLAADDKLWRIVNFDYIVEIRKGVADIKQMLHLQAQKLRPGDSMSLRNDWERSAARTARDRFRGLPAEVQERFPDLINEIGMMLAAAGDFDQAIASFKESARLSPDQAAQAIAHHNAYLAQVEARNWDSALESLKKAVALDADRFEPFPFAKYEPRRIIGAGGFGVAFLCRQTRTGASRVVKTLEKAGIGRDMGDIFKEAMVLESLNHPGIIRLHDADYADDQQTRPYLVMDYFDGMTLEEHVRRNGPLNLRHATQLACALADALDAAHRQGVLHRDVKPANVLVRINTNGLIDVKLIDFGLAAAAPSNDLAASANGNTLAGSSLLGTLEYAAPEQLGRIPGAKPGSYSDVYSFAKTLCYAMFKTATPLRKHYNSMPHVLAEFIDRCLAEPVEERPATITRDAVEQVMIAKQTAQTVRIHLPPRPTPEPEEGEMVFLNEWKPGSTLLPPRPGESALSADYDKAVKGDGNAACRIAWAHDSANPSAIRKDDRTAVYWYRYAIDLGNARAMNNYGWMCKRGSGGAPNDPAQAMMWYQKSASLGDTRAMGNLGSMYEEGAGGLAKSDSDAFKWYLKAAQGGDAGAMLSLAAMYKNGRGTPKNETEAFNWYKKAADLGDAAAMTNAGSMYETGRGVAKDLNAALDLYEKAAKLNEPYAMVNLAMMHRDGRGVAQNSAMALEWYKKAAQLNHASAMTSLGWMLESGRGVPKNDAEAYKWYRKAAELNEPFAMNNIGIMQREGRAVPRDDAEALKWFEKAAKLNHPAAMNNMGWMHEMGRGLPKNLAIAVLWYRKGAALSDPLSMNNLACALMDGRGAAQNLAEAEDLLTVALKIVTDPGQRQTLEGSMQKVRERKKR